MKTSISLVVFWLSTTCTHAFISTFSTTTARTGGGGALCVLSEPEQSSSPPIILNGINIDLTPAIEAYVDKRIGKTLAKLSSNGAVRECDVVLSVSKNPKVKEGHRVEVVTNLVGTTIICKNASPDMYESIDAAAHALQRKLRKYKERRTDGWHKGSRKVEGMQAALEEIEEPNDASATEEAFVDPYKGEVTKVKSFQLEHAVSLEEAVFSLDYVDHDFYVFRNKETNEINVVYKMHAGGVGHVEP